MKDSGFFGSFSTWRANFLSLSYVSSSSMYFLLLFHRKLSNLFRSHDFSKTHTPSCRENIDSKLLQIWFEFRPLAHLLFFWEWPLAYYNFFLLLYCSNTGNNEIYSLHLFVQLQMNRIFSIQQNARVPILHVCWSIAVPTAALKRLTHTRVQSTAEREKLTDARVHARSNKNGKRNSLKQAAVNQIHAVLTSNSMFGSEIF